MIHFALTMDVITYLFYSALNHGSVHSGCHYTTVHIEFTKVEYFFKHTAKMSSVAINSEMLLINYDDDEKFKRNWMLLARLLKN